MDTEPTIYIVDDDPGMLKSLSRLLLVEGYVVRTFSSAQEFLQAHDPLIWGCIVMDVKMPDINGLELQEKLLASGNERFIVFITGQSNVETSVQAMKMGAVDFLSKPFDDEEFLAAIRNALIKDEHVRRIRLELQSIHLRMDTLTPRELEVMRQVVTGRLNKQIAADLGIAEKTIKVHRARAMEKMHVASLAELVRVVFEADIGAIIDEPLYKNNSYRLNSSLPLPGVGNRNVSY